MLKKIGLFLLSLLFIAPAYADSVEVDFSSMNPTVKITSYKTTFTDQVVAYGSGSGTVISSDGYLLTNHHVIFDEENFKPLDAFEVCITFDFKQKPECQYTAQLVSYDADLDIALLKLLPVDIFGNELPALNFLNYQNQMAPPEQSEITVLGYPASGGDTITVTKGQVSGFEEFNGYNYFKTDTDFDNGSSGGTAINADGDFVGIPTYIRSYAENVGFFLDLTEAQDWIKKNLTGDPVQNNHAEKILQNDRRRFKSANDSLSYTQENYPFIKLDLPDNWEFLEINKNSFYASQKNASKPISISVQMIPYLFPIDEVYLDRLDEELQPLKEAFSDYKKEEVIFAGQDSWRVTYTNFSSWNVNYYIPYGYQLIVVSYSLDLNQIDAQKELIEPIINTLNFTQEPQSNPDFLSSIKFFEPSFSIDPSGDWRLLVNPDRYQQELLIEGIEKNNFEGRFRVYYRKTPKDQQVLSSSDKLKDITDNFYGQRLIYKNDQVILGGLKGFLYTYEYEGKKYQQIRKNLTIQLADGDYYFLVEYDDLGENFEKSLPSIKKMLDSLRFNTKNADLALLNSYGTLNYIFSDIQYHPYALAIGELADKSIVSAKYSDKFKPENPVSRIEALRWILDSKNKLESKKESKKVINFSEFDKRQKYPLDVVQNSDRAYVYYAKEQQIISDQATQFNPYKTINLAEVLKLILLTYEIPLWEGETNPWFKKYIDKGFELRLIPYGMYDPAQQLTRGEVANLIYGIYSKAK